MAVNIVNPATGEMDLVGMDNAQRGMVFVDMTYNASSVDASYFVAPRGYRVKYIIGRVTAAGTNGSAVTAAVKKAPSGTAIASGTALHSSTMDLKGTADTNQVLTLSTTSTDLDIAAGDAIGIDFTGTLTSATGVITVALAPK